MPWLVASAALGRGAAFPSVGGSSTKRLLLRHLAFVVVERDMFMFAREHMTSCLFIYLVSYCLLQFIWPIKNYKTYFASLSNTLPSLSTLLGKAKSLFFMQEHFPSWVLHPLSLIRIFNALGNCCAGFNATNSSYCHVVVTTYSSKNYESRS